MLPSWPTIRTKAILSSLLIAASLLARPVSAFETTAAQAMLLDMTTGTVLLEKNADEPMTPSSMSKMMTLYTLFDRLKDGRLSLDDTFQVSEEAWRKGGSKMFVEVGKRVRVEDLIRGIAIQSGNDACIVVAEGIAGTEEAFAELLNEKAKQIGLTGSHFVNASGWPDPGHVMTARDLARLAQKTITDFPEYYHFYSETEFTYAGIHQTNRNPLLYANIGADGMKTGHTEAGGYGLTASAVRGDRRLVLVVNGLDSMKSRGAESARLIDWGFREFDNYALFRKGEAVTEAEVWLGEEGTVPLYIDQDVVITLPRKSRRDLKVTVAYESPLPAPIQMGSQVATLKVTAPDFETMEIPLFAGNTVAQLGFMGRLGAAIEFILWGESS